MQKKYIILIIILFILSGVSYFKISQNNNYNNKEINYYNWKQNLPHYMPSIEEFDDLTKKVVGIDKIDKNRGENLLSELKEETDNKWMDSQKDLEILYSIPFYGNDTNIIAYEHILGCENKICGYIYDSFPTTNDLNEAVKQINPNASCMITPEDDEYMDKNLEYMVYDECRSIEVSKEGNIEAGYVEVQDNDRISGLNFYLVPDVTPISYRIYKLMDNPKTIKFYHSIYAIDEDNNVYSLDKSDENLTLDIIKDRLNSLITFFRIDGLTSKLLEERGISEYTGYQTTRNKEDHIKVSSLEKVDFNKKDLMNGGTSFLNGKTATLELGSYRNFYTENNFKIDMLTGRVNNGIFYSDIEGSEDPIPFPFNSKQTTIKTYLDY